MTFFQLPREETLIITHLSILLSTSVAESQDFLSLTSRYHLVLSLLCHSHQIFCDLTNSFLDSMANFMKEQGLWN